jgi:hypothetical protein
VAKVTLKDLQAELKKAREVIKLQENEIIRLNDTLDQVKYDKGVVLKREFDKLLEDFKDAEKRCEEYVKLILKGSNKQTEQEKELDDLKRRLIDAQSHVKTEVVPKRVHNERGAGRKPYQNEKVIRYMFQMYASGKSLQDIANILNHDGISTQTGRMWGKSAVRMVIQKNLALASEKEQQLISERFRK